MPIPFIARLPFAIAIVVWGARTNRRWTVPVAGMLALPALWYGGLSMLLAVIVLREQDADAVPRRTEPGLSPPCAGRGRLIRLAGQTPVWTAALPRRRPRNPIAIAPNTKTIAPTMNGAETPMTVTMTPASAGPTMPGEV